MQMITLIDIHNPQWYITQQTIIFTIALWSEQSLKLYAFNSAVIAS